MTGLLDDVSRETLDRLQAFESLVVKWTPRINLISRDSMATLWHRHILDSIQLYRAAPLDFSHWADIGSGGGFPGIVVAIMVMERSKGQRITLVESDARKCAFLRAALRETGATATVLNDRIEKVAPLEADILSARALADLKKLLSYAERHLKSTGKAIFAKGASWQQEVAAAKSRWNFDFDVVRSNLEADAAILSISGVSRV